MEAHTRHQKHFEMLILSKHLEVLATFSLDTIYIFFMLSQNVKTLSQHFEIVSQHLEMLTKNVEIRKSTFQDANSKFQDTNSTFRESRTCI